MWRLLVALVVAQASIESAVGQDIEPTTRELLAGAKEFHKQWQSVQMESRGKQLQLLQSNDGWVEHGFEQKSLAWNSDRWHRLEKSAYEFLKVPGQFHADLLEALGEQNTVIQISGELRPPTAKEMSDGDLSWIDHEDEDIVASMGTSWFDGEAGMKRYSTFRTNRFELLNGWTPGADELLLNQFDPAQCKEEAVTFLDRPCWKISQSNLRTTGSASVTICPELGNAPVEFTLSLTGNDRLPSGSLVREVVDSDGRTRSSHHREVRMESVSPDWSEFTMRQVTWIRYTDDSVMGFGSLEHFSNVVRPAPEEAFRLEIPINNGTPVTLQNSRQLQAEWRDGKVVRVYDGEAVKELATVAMKPPERTSWPEILVMTLGCIVAAIAWHRFRSQKTQK